MLAQRRIPVLAASAGTVVAVTLPLSFPPDGGPTTFDSAIDAPVDAALGPGAGSVLIAPSNTPVVLTLLALAVVWFAAHRMWWQTASMLVVPELATAINSWVLKPLFDRPLQDYLAYPSGHTVHLVSVAVTFAVLVGPGRARTAVLVATALVLLPVGAGMIEFGYHHPTDVLGGAAAAVALTLTLCGIATALRHEAGRPAARDSGSPPEIPGP